MMWKWFIYRRKKAEYMYKYVMYLAVLQIKERVQYSAEKVKRFKI